MHCVLLHLQKQQNQRLAEEPWVHEYGFIAFSNDQVSHRESTHYRDIPDTNCVRIIVMLRALAWWHAIALVLYHLQLRIAPHSLRSSVALTCFTSYWQYSPFNYKNMDKLFITLTGIFGLLLTAGCVYRYFSCINSSYVELVCAVAFFISSIIAFNTRNYCK